MKRCTKGTRARAGRHVLAGALAAAAVAAPTGAVADDIYLKLEGIEGESISAKHPKEIDVISWSWGFRREVTAAKTACAQEIHITKLVDRATPGLLTRASVGTTVPTGRLSVAKSGELAIDYLTLDFTGVTVKSMQSAGSQGGDSSVETISLAWTSGVLTYRQVDPKGGIGATLNANLPPTCLPPQPAADTGR